MGRACLLHGVRGPSREDSEAGGCLIWRCISSCARLWSWKFSISRTCDPSVWLGFLTRERPQVITRGGSGSSTRECHQMRSLFDAFFWPNRRFSGFQASDEIEDALSRRRPCGVGDVIVAISGKAACTICPPATIRIIPHTKYTRSSPRRLKSRPLGRRLRVLGSQLLECLPLHPKIYELKK